MYHGNQRLLEYDFVLAPGADPRAIDLRFLGAKKLSVNGEGALVIKLGESEVIEHAPVVYQEIAGHRQTVAGRYVLRGRGRVGFNLGTYDKSQSLVIDPPLVYSTFLGSTSPDASENDTGWRIAVDASGNAYVAGWTNSPNFPTANPFQGTFSGGGAHDYYGDVFVSKLNATGSDLVYSTYLGGSDDDRSGGIAVDPSGSAYVEGITSSADFPTTPGPFQSTTGGVFAAKLSPTGSSLVYSIVLPGSSGLDSQGSITVDSSGHAYITGEAISSNFPTTPGAFRTSFGANPSYAFVSKLSADGTALVYSTLLGNGVGRGIALDGSGNAYVAGLMYTGDDFPATPGAYKTTLSVGVNGFITKLNATGAALAYSTFLGGLNFDIYGIAVDAFGAAYVTGQASSSYFPITPGAFQTVGSSDRQNSFVTKLNAAGSALVYSTYLGSGIGLGIAVDALGNAYVTGLAADDLPTTPDAIPSPTNEGGFLTKLNASGSALIYSTYLSNACTDAAVDGSGNVFVTGNANMLFNGFPTTLGAFQPFYSPENPGGRNTAAFVTKLSIGISPPGPVPTVNLSGLLGNSGWYRGPVTVTLNPTAQTVSYTVDSRSDYFFGPFSISGDGAHHISFYSFDNSGGQEAFHFETVNVDATPPVSSTMAPATATSPNFRVGWGGTDATSGIQGYSIYVSGNGGPFTPWLTQTSATQAWFVGSLGHTYGFYSIAQDRAGNREFKTAADATTQVPAQMPGEVNGDGKIDCADITLVKASFGKRTGQPGFNPAADVNHDGVVDVRDLAIVSQKLIPGTTCP